MDPKIYLGIDNCFASKRWVRPAEWMRVIGELGLKYVEASADTECDPLYMDPEFTRDWIEDVKKHASETGVCVKNVYSGHGTYATCGLSHYDARVTRRFRDEWMKAQLDTAKALGAGFGFFAHGFEELLLQDDAAYVAKLDELYDTLADIASYARKIGVDYVGLEQMYSPHQPPWTVAGTRKLLAEVYRRSGVPFYITADLGHMNGQQYFAKPDESLIRTAIESARSGQRIKRLWLGTDRAFDLYEAAIAGSMTVDAAVEGILEDVVHNPHLFAETEDWSIDHWVRALGCYAPIIHLQQSDGRSSPHWPFSLEYNRKGVVDAKSVLNALCASYRQNQTDDMPPMCGEVVLTLEPFIGTAGSTHDLLWELKQSVEYWREWIPEDGMRLSALVEKL